MAEIVGGFAGELVELGARGGRVALVCGNSIEISVAMFAVHAAGAQAVPINPIYTARELSHILSDSAPVAVIYDDETASKVGILWTQVEDAVVELDGCMKTEAAREVEEEWRRFKEEFDRFYDILTDAIEP